MSQVNQPRESLSHQDVEDEVGALKAVWDRLPECGAADAARRHLELSEEAAHRAVETSTKSMLAPPRGGAGATAESGLLG